MKAFQGVIGFCGLGVMGAPMAGHLAARGFSVRAYNRTPEKAQAWAEAQADQPGARTFDTLEAAADGADVFITCVGDDPDLNAVFETVLPCLRSGALWIDHTTASATLTRELAANAAAAGVEFLDAPVSGGQAGAQAGRLTIMCGGDESAFSRAFPVLEAYGKSITRIGPSGHGQLAKMANQICIAGVVQGLAEAVNFAQAAQLDLEAVFAALSKGAAQSWQMENRHATMAKAEFDFGFAVDWMRKDLRIVLDEARSLGVQTPLTRLVDQFYGEIQALGGGRWDTSSLIVRLKEAKPPSGSSGA